MVGLQVTPYCWWARYLGKNAPEIGLWEEPQHIKAINCDTNVHHFALGFLEGAEAFTEGQLGPLPFLLNFSPSSS